MENNPIYVNMALESGYDVEVDVYSVSGKCFLGHDIPQYEVGWDYLSNPKFWCHAKNIEALEIMLEKQIHCFWHQQDDVTLTSRGFVWTYPGKQLTSKSICVLPENIKNNNFDIAAGLCSDFVSIYTGKASIDE